MLYSPTRTVPVEMRAFANDFRRHQKERSGLSWLEFTELLDVM